MDKKVGIVGYAQTHHSGDIDKTRDMMVFETAKGALDNAGITREDLDTVVNASNDYLDGRTISNVHITMPEGAYMKDESKVEEDGSFGALYVLMRILSDTHDIGMVVGNTQGSTFNPHQISTYMFDPLWDRQIGVLNDISAAALQASRYMAEYGVTEEQIAKVSLKNLVNAADNPKAQRKIPDLTLDDVLVSELLYDPVRELTAAPVSDGACAVILASEEKAREITDSPVWIEGVGSCQDPYYSLRDLNKLGSLEKAARKAYDMAGIDEPVSELDVLEVSEKFAHEELMIYEALGLCGEGRGGMLMDNWFTDTLGQLPVNPSGGALSADPITATGLIRIAEAAEQVKGESGRCQVPDVDKALAHGQSGICAQSNTVFILGGD